MVYSDVPGLICVNGRLVGETGETPLAVPVSPRGAVYLEHRPMARGCLPLAGRVTFSGGRALPESITQGLWALCWPSGVVEVEMKPERLEEAETTRAGGPEDARAAHLADGTTRLVEPLGDTVGHARLCGWRPTEIGWEEMTPEIVWAEDAPHWPQTPEDTALALAEAALLNLAEEARGYLTPSAAARGVLSALSGFDGCLPMKYPLPDGRACVGMLELLGAQMARVTPRYYRAVAMGGGQGPWRIDDIFVD